MKVPADIHNIREEILGMFTKERRTQEVKRVLDFLRGLGFLYDEKEKLAKWVTALQAKVDDHARVKMRGATRQEALDKSIRYIQAEALHLAMNQTGLQKLESFWNEDRSTSKDGALLLTCLAAYAGNQFPATDITHSKEQVKFALNGHEYTLAWDVDDPGAYYYDLNKALQNEGSPWRALESTDEVSLLFVPQGVIEPLLMADHLRPDKSLDNFFLDAVPPAVPSGFEFWQAFQKPSKSSTKE